MKISIRLKIALLVFGIISVVCIAVSLIIIDQLKTPLENEIEKKAAAIARNLVSSSSESILTKDELRLNEDVQNSGRSDPGVLYAMVVDKEGKIIAHSDPLIRKGTRLNDLASLGALTAGSGFYKQDTTDPKTGVGVLDISRAIIVKNKELGIVRVGYSKLESEKVIAKISKIIFVVAGIAIVVTIAISLFVINLMVRPIEQLTQAVRLFGQGRLDTKIIVNTNDEIRELADSFNETVEILDRTQSKLRRRVRDISTLLNAAKELNFSLDMKNLASVLLYTCKEHVNAKSAALYLLLSEEEAILSFHISSGLKNDENIIFDPGEPLFRYIIENRKLHLMSDLVEACKETDTKNLEKLKLLNCEILAPVIVKDRINGLLVLGPCKYEHEYHEEDWEFLSALMGMANVAIENSYLHTLSITDGLTKAYLRRYFLFRLEEEVKRVRRYGGGISVLMIDLDFFKKINDTYGHQAGDKVLKKFVEIVKGISRSTDLIARYGGEEFAILATETSRDGAIIYAERIRSSVENHEFEIGATKIKVTVSLGVASYPVDASKQNDLIAKADEMLYKAKEGGRNRVCLPEVSGS